MCNFDDPAELWRETLQAARKQYRCGECSFPILSGQRYVRVFIIHDGDASTHRAHPECRTLAIRAAEVACGEPYWVAGELVEHLTEAGVRVWPGDGDVPEIKGVADPQKLELANAWGAIVRKYSGMEPELGGEAG